MNVMHRLAAFWVSLRASLWFVPTVFVLCAIIMALVLVEAGRFEPFSQTSLPRYFGYSAEGSREMLSAIASSMITVAGVAFSVTIVALSLASSQYSPRVLRHFMRDRGNQTVLGVFVGIYAYCLVVLPMVRGGEEQGYVPALAVAVGVVLALIGVGCLIYFIHHVATAIQPSSIVEAIAAETHKAIDEIFPNSLGEAGEPAPEEIQNMQWRQIPAPTSGMLQLVDEAALLSCAASHDVVLRMECHIGDFVIAGTPLAAVNGQVADEPAFAKEVASLFTISRTRTVEQDAAYGFRQIVDVALRALSPSLNDTTTAILCINYLADLLRHAAVREVESSHRRHEGRLRVIATRAKFADFVHLAFDQVRESGASNAAIIERLLWAIEKIGGEVQDASRRQSLVEAAQLIGDSAQREITNPGIRAALAERARQVVQLIRTDMT